MVKRNPKAVLTGIRSLTLAVSAIAPGTVSAEEPTLRELATATREKAREATIRLILARQKGDQLKLYLRGSRSMFMNGKSISTEILSTVIKESGIEQAVITTSPDVHPDRVAEIEKLIQKNGIDNVTTPAPKTLHKLVAESRAKAARDRGRTLREILSRQKGDS
jgi:biopolymer transport protein ExbD